jgi:hypothetical protein
MVPAGGGANRNADELSKSTGVLNAFLLTPWLIAHLEGFRTQVNRNAKRQGPEPSRFSSSGKSGALASVAQREKAPFNGTRRSPYRATPLP